MLKELPARIPKAGRKRILAATAVLVALVSLADWSTGNTVSLAVLYILPMMVGALVLGPGEIAVLALVCALLRSRFDVPSSEAELVLRFAFASLAYVSSGLFVSALVRNRDMALSHLERMQKEQTLRREAEEQVRVLVESSPAAVLTLDHRGVVVAANRAANELFALSEDQSLRGRVIASYLPLLSDALRLETAASGFRTAAQCYGRREDGEVFLANTWFSTYAGPQGTHLAAIVVDSSEEMRDREEQNLRELLRHNRIAAAAVSHDVRNLCGAVSIVCANLSGKHNLGQDEDFQGLINLVKGLEHVAELELQSRAREAVGETSLRAVLDNLRIVIEPGWREIDGTVHWRLPDRSPRVFADQHGLLQAFLNLAQNSLRAVQDSPRRELSISVSCQEKTVAVRFEDTGPGVPAPERLFQPFQQGAGGSGMGLYISRAVVRSYGGELRFEPRERGSCFVVELQEGS